MNGILLVDKPQDWTSFDVCGKLRGALGEKRVGHGGTLDPLATGLLTAFLGRATRAVEFAEAADKTYEAALRLGLVTDTQDITGEVLRRGERVSPDPGELEAVLERFRGEIMQLPPMYSAVKVRGQPLYKAARKGIEVERQPRKVTVHELTVTGEREGDILLRVRCSKGTYIRTLCHDIGGALGCGGAMSALRRTRAGTFSVEEAHSLEEILAAAERGEAERLLLPVERLFPEAKKLTLSPTQEKAVRNGGPYSCRLGEGRYRLYGQNGEFLAIAELRRGTMRPIKSFFEVD